MYERECRSNVDPAATRNVLPEHSALKIMGDNGGEGKGVSEGKAGKQSNRKNYRKTDASLLNFHFERPVATHQAFR